MADQNQTSDPLAQLTLVHEELNRQRAFVADRHSSMQGRATILIGAAGVSAGIQIANLPHWILWTVLISSVVAATLGAISIRATRGPDIDVRKLRATVLGADLYSAEYALVNDKIDAHDFDVLALEQRRRLVIAGFLFLGLSWLETIILIAFEG